MDYTILYFIVSILILPAIIFGIFAQIRVTSTFEKFKKEIASCNLTAKEVAQKILDYHDASDVKIVEIGGSLSDNYNHSKKTISLSSAVYSSKSIAAIGVASHECGHALQYKDNYIPIKIRNFIIPIANIASKILMPLIIIGMLFSFLYFLGLGSVFIWAGVIFYGISFLLELVTLPVEFNASKRAKNILTELGFMSREEIEKTNKVLNSAALTYVASMIVSLLYFLRFLLIILRFSNRD